MPEQHSDLATLELAITSFHPGRTGGVIIGKDSSTDTMVRALAPHQAMSRHPAVGETWRLIGTMQAHPDFGLQLHVRFSLPLLPQGRALIRYLATNPSFEGIGWGLAKRLWDALGDRLYEVIKARDPASLAPVIGADLAVRLVDQFGMFAEEVEVFRWLDRYGINPRTAGAAASLWGVGAIEKIKADPYVLTLLEPWSEVDARALRLGTLPDDPRRLLAAVDEALARRYRRGHTASSKKDVIALLPTLLGRREANLAEHAVKIAVATGRVVGHSTGLLQSRAIWFMEREVEDLVRRRLARTTIAPPADEIEAAVAEIERQESYQLTRAQREAVFMAVSSPISVISGGAGTGKTTVVKAVLAASERRRSGLPPSDRHGFEFPQVALAGRAVKRIAEATGREASTIARFLRSLKSGRRKLKQGLMVFDESSMLDLPALYQLLVALPPEMDLLFIGDPAQLPPIGPGLIFHRMVESQDIPKVILDVIHRQNAETGIPAVAAGVRHGHMADLPSFDPLQPLAHGVFIVPTQAAEDQALATMAVFSAMAGPPPKPGGLQGIHDRDIQILCATKRGASGAVALNDTIEKAYAAHQVPIRNWGLCIGSKVMWLRNDYGKAPQRDTSGDPLRDPVSGEPVYAGFMNGALGVVRRATRAGAWVEFDDGAEDEITVGDLEKLTLGWAISVHKAQGSAFRRVIIPVTTSRLLDRSLIYTAITRAVETVVLVGDPALIRRTIEATPTAYRRETMIDFEMAAERA
ncbi:MAG TPA: AAA family ATPase [Dongiaceae bacterium]|nr:AAA family ATPase [Dongiaceae bacterium]